MSKSNKEEVINLIRKLQNGGGKTDEEDIFLANEIGKNVPFGKEIIDTIFWSDEELTPEEIYNKCEKEYKPIIL